MPTSNTINHSSDLNDQLNSETQKSNTPPPYPQTPEQNHLKGNKKSHPIIIVIGVILVVIIGLLTYLHLNYTSFKIVGPSMDPTIKNGQTVLVKKSHNVPSIGEIIIFTESGLSKYGQPNTLTLDKRVVALAGDRVVITNGKLTVFNSAKPNGFDPDDYYGLSNQNTSGNINVIVPSGDVYVLGDNRPDSLDSRDFGPIPIKNIIGKIINQKN